MEDAQRQALKIVALREALRERVAAITDEYESRIIDLRLEITDLGNQLDEARQIIMNYQMAEEPIEVEPLEAEVVEETKTRNTRKSRA